MGLFVHEATTPVHPKDDPDVRAAGHEVEQARATLSDIESRVRTLEAERDAPHDEVHMLLAAQEAAGLRARYIDARVGLAQAQKQFDVAFQHAQGPWQQQAQKIYREEALDYLTWLEQVALPATQKMLAATEAAQQAGLRVEPLAVPQLFSTPSNIDAVLVAKDWARSWGDVVKAEGDAVACPGKNPGLAPHHAATRGLPDPGHPSGELNRQPFP